MTAKRSSLAPRRILYFLVYLLTALWLVPIVTALITSLRTNADILTRGFWVVPHALTLQNFSEAWNRGGLDRYLPIASSSPYRRSSPRCFSRPWRAMRSRGFRFRGDRLFLYVFVAGMMLPFQILLLPVFRLTDILHIYNTYWALIIFHTAFQLGFCTFVLRNYMRTIPGEILEAARIGRMRRISHLLADHAAIDRARTGRTGHAGVHLDLQRFSVGADPDPERQTQARYHRPGLAPGAVHHGLDGDHRGLAHRHCAHGAHFPGLAALLHPGFDAGLGQIARNVTERKDCHP